MQQAGLVIARGQQLVPHAWPHDGLQHDKGGEEVRKQYVKYGINMTPERAQFEATAEGKPGGSHVEPGIAMMLDRFQTRTLRVFAHLEDWFAEFRMYYRKEGLIVKEDDDLMSATRYGIMMLRKAKSLGEIGAMTGNRRGLARPLEPFRAFDPSVAY